MMTKINLVSLSGEQLWPTIHSIAHFGDRIEKLFLLHTEDETKSARPARSVHNFAVSWCKNIQVIMPRNPIKNNPWSISRALHQWMEDHPGKQWVFNASGGTKLMLLGILDFVNLDNVQILYRDLTGIPGEIWHSLSRMPDLGFLNANPIEIPEDATDAIPVKVLVETIWGDSGNFHIDFGPPPPAIDLEKTTQIASLNQWNFKKTFEAMGYPAAASSGQLFEQYVTAILQGLGIKNSVCNAVRKSHDGNSFSEIDIISNHKGSLTIIDCKMRNEDDEKTGKVESLFDQIRKTHMVGNELGGLGAKIILLRPNRTLSANEQLLANSYRIKFFDAPKISKIIDHFAEHFGIAEIPNHLLNLQNIIFRSQANQIYPGMGPAPFRQEWDHQTRQTGIIDLNSNLQNLQNDLNQTWIVFLFDNNFFVDFLIPKPWLKLNTTILEKRILEKINHITRGLADLEISALANKRSRVKMTAPPGKILELKRIFQARFGKELFS